MQRIGKLRILPIATVHNTDQALHVAEALQEGGLDIVEFTFRSGPADSFVAAVLKSFPNMLVGAGTILRVDQLQRAVDAGARFGLAPGLNEVIISRAFDLDLPFLPGVLTPSEISRAIAIGCKLLKFFPAEHSGGVDMLNAVATPFAGTGVKFVPTGGITMTNATDYLALPTVSAIAGTWLVPHDILELKNWNHITRLATAALNL